ncbi:MAG: DUF3311 domain-containing protein [Candidatus Poribacteria bacterium]
MNGRLPPWIIVVLLAALLLLHNDFWFWTDARLVLGLPIGMVYHIAYCFAATGMMVLLVKHAWPTHIDDDDEEASS